MAYHKEQQKQKLNRKKEDGFIDFTLLFVIFFLIGFGLLMLYSSSSYSANLQHGDSAFFLKRQVAAAGVGLAVMVAVALFPYRNWRHFAIPAYIVSVVALLLIIPFGAEINHAKRWIYVSGVSVQPAEIAKLGIILFLAALINRIGRKGVSGFKGVCFVLLWAAPLSLMIWKITSNLSSAIIVFGIAFLMVFVASPNYRGYLLLTVLVGALAAGIITYARHIPFSEMGYRGARIVAWLNPEADASNHGFQTLQALYAIGSGGLFGKGLGQSMQKLGFLPEAQNDMIFSIICEELGMFGAVAIMTMFLILIWRCVVIANNAPDLFGALLVVGVLSHVAIQVILNIAVVTNTIPNTGISLPFISYGGSALICQLVEMGLVLGVGQGIRLKDLK